MAITSKLVTFTSVRYRSPSGNLPLDGTLCHIHHLRFVIQAMTGTSEGV
jgi:hypothetical protein